MAHRARQFCRAWALRGPPQETHLRGQQELQATRCTCTTQNGSHTVNHSRRHGRHGDRHQNLLPPPIRLFRCTRRRRRARATFLFHLRLRGLPRMHASTAPLSGPSVPRGGRRRAAHRPSELIPCCLSAFELFFAEPPPVVFVLARRSEHQAGVLPRTVHRVLRGARGHPRKYVYTSANGAP